MSGDKENGLRKPDGSLIRQLELYRDSGYYPFHMPGHKRNMPPEAGEVLQAAAGLDITEIDGFDDFHCPEGVIARAQELADEVNRAAARACVKPLALSDWRQIPEGRYLAIQGTKVGLAPDSDRAPIEEEGFYRLIHTGCDLVYRPARTKFMRLVEEAGGRAYNGLKMLLYQGIEAYELWTGVSVTESQAEICYARMKKELFQDE